VGLSTLITLVLAQPASATAAPSTLDVRHMTISPFRCRRTGDCGAAAGAVYARVVPDTVIATTLAMVITNVPVSVITTETAHAI
jgi:hypothetical protein